MDRRGFSKRMLLAGAGTGFGGTAPAAAGDRSEGYYEEPARRLPIRTFDVLVAGGGTGGVVAAIAAARQGVKTALIELKGYPGGTVTEGGTALHSYYNRWKAFSVSRSDRSSRESPRRLTISMGQGAGGRHRRGSVCRPRLWHSRLALRHAPRRPEPCRRVF